MKKLSIFFAIGLPVGSFATGAMYLLFLNLGFYIDDSLLGLFIKASPFVLGPATGIQVCLSIIRVQESYTKHINQ